MTDVLKIADETYFNVSLNTEAGLPTERGTLLHFFEQIQKTFPPLRNFYARERGEYVLEEDKDQGAFRWTTVEPKRISSGWTNPPSMSEAMNLHRSILEVVPYTLNVSNLDCESLNVTFGFDFNYRGNHNELLMEALGTCPALERGLAAGGRLIAHDYALTMALEEDCRTQFRLQLEPRTTAYQARTGEFGEEPVSVYFTVRRFGSLDPGDSYIERLNRLFSNATSLLEGYVLENILTPIQQTIAIQ